MSEVAMTTLVFAVDADYVKAMKAKDAVSKAALNNLKAEFKATETDAQRKVRGPLSHDESLATVRRVVKRYQESIDAFQKADRPEKVAELQAEQEIIKKYLPAGLSEDDVRSIVTSIIAANNITAPKEAGKVVGLFNKTHKGQADGAVVLRIATEILETA